MEMIKLLACPQCKQPLRRTQSDTGYVCEKHGEFLDQGEFPSFVSDYDPAFEKHWESNQNSAVPIQKVSTASEFLKPLIAHLKSSDSRYIFDAGCGEGAHAAALAKEYAQENSVSYLGMDIAVSGLQQAQHECPKKFRFLHGDLSELPIAENTFDAVFSFGVLHLTPFPEASFQELVRVLKPGGILGLWVFNSSPLMKIGLRAARRLCRMTGEKGTDVVANCIVPIYGALPTRSGLSSNNGGKAETKEVLLSNLTPPHMHFLDRPSLERWSRSNDVMPLMFDDDNELTFWGTKASSSTA